jgi:hypothetical protein
MTKRRGPKDEHPLAPAAPDLLDELPLLREIPPDLRGVEVRECRLADADSPGAMPTASSRLKAKSRRSIWPAR